MPKLCSEMNIMHGKNFVNGSCATGFSARKRYSDEAFFNEVGIRNTRNSQACSLQKENPEAITATYFQTRFSANIRCGIIGNPISGQFEVQDRLTGERCGCSKMAHRHVLIVLPFSVNSFQTVR
jgi:hypothetical protein